MKRNSRSAAMMSLAAILFAATGHAQKGAADVYWHINPGVKTCSMIIDPSLTQDQWHRFTRQVGAISSFKSLAPAATLGSMQFNVALEYGSTPVDQRDPAWINTFAHPDEDCPLGDAVAYPILRASMGVSDNLDVGGYWTKAPGANYGMIGAEVKYGFLKGSGLSPAAAVRASMTVLTGVADFNMNVYSVDILASDEVAFFRPYVGLKTSLVVGSETTSKVDLKTESILLPQGYAGVACSVWLLNVAAEYNVSSVNTFALTLGVNF